MVMDETMPYANSLSYPKSRDAIASKNKEQKTIAKINQLQA